MLPFCISLLLQSPHHPLLHLWKCFDKAQAQTVNFDFSFCNMINDFINFDDAGGVLAMFSTVPLTPRTCRIPLSCRMSSYSETWSHKWKMRAALSKLKTTDLQQLISWHPWYFLNPSFTLFMRHSKRDCFPKTRTTTCFELIKYVNCNTFIARILQVWWGPEWSFCIVQGPSPPHTSAVNWSYS